MRLMRLPYFDEKKTGCSQWVGCIQIAREGNCWVAIDVRPDRCIGFEIQSVAFSPGREEVAAQYLLKHVTQWLEQLGYSWWPEFDAQRVARAMASMIHAGPCDKLLDLLKNYVEWFNENTYRLSRARALIAQLESEKGGEHE